MLVQSIIDTYKYLKTNLLLAGYPLINDIARGRISGARAVSIEGYIKGIPNAIRDISQLGVNNIPIPSLSGVTMQIKSTSVNDTLLGSGSRKVIVEYIEPTTEILTQIEVNLNGTTAVTIPVPIAFVSDFYVSDSASLITVSAGDITIFNGSTIYNIIKAGDNKSMSLFRYIPKGKMLYISSIHISGNSKAVSVCLGANVTDNLTRINNFIHKTIQVSADGTSLVQFDPPMVIPQQCYLKGCIYSDSVDNSGMISMGINGWIENFDVGSLNR